MTQAHKDPAPVAGLHLVKTTSREEDSLASDCVDLLHEGLRGSTDCDVGGVEETVQSTLDRDAERRTEWEFMQAVALRVKERCSDWVSGADGLRVAELAGRNGWRFSVADREGRRYAVEISYSEILEIARAQRNATLSNFAGILDRVAQRLNETRASYFSRRDAATAEISS